MIRPFSNWVERPSKIRLSRPDVSTMSLTPAEDEELRRLAALADFGALTPAMAAIYDELRSRDRRTEIRAPRVIAVPLPRTDHDSVQPARR